MRNEKGQFVKGSIPTNAFKKGNVPWNKGLILPGFGFQPGHEVSEEVRQKLREANLGENSPNFGTKRSDETKEKIRVTKLRDKNPNWNGGKKTLRGYVYILKPEHPLNNAGYVLEHRLVMEDAIGRYLTKEEVVHHINGIRNDNRIENLMLFENDGKHKAYHHQQNRLNKIYKANPDVNIIVSERTANSGYEWASETKVIYLKKKHKGIS